MTDIHAIFFDLGMVLVTFDWNLAIPRFAARNRGQVELIRQFLAHPYHEAFERGECSPKEFFRRGRVMMGFTGTYKEFLTYWNEIFTEIPSGVQWVHRLAPQYACFALSNTNILHAHYLERQFGWMGLFRGRLYSCDLGVRKPDVRLYEMALARARVEPPRALLIDDRLENIEGAQKLGMQTLHAPTPALLAERAAEYFSLRLDGKRVAAPKDFS